MKNKILSTIMAAVIALTPIIAAADDTDTAAETKAGIQNGDFSLDLEGWTATNTQYAAVSNGKLVLSNSDSAYEEKVYQNVVGLENGTYDLTVNTTSTSISGTCYVYAKSAGHTIVSTAVPTATMKITVPSVVIDNGECEIGIYVKNSTTTLTADNFTFTPTASTRVPFMTGGEISKLTYVEDKGESLGVKFHYADGTAADGLQVLAENGFNLARIRVLNNPGKGNGNDAGYYLPEGYQTLDDCLNMAKRAKDKGMAIELTIAYSDWWTDGGEQYPPNEWLDGADGLSGSELADYYADKIYEYTKTVMQAMIEQGTTPEYVSIGNEMQRGMCFHSYESQNGLFNNTAYIAQLATAGAKAVRELALDTKIILHSDYGGKVLSKRQPFANALSLMGDYYDIIGVSYYPYNDSTVSIDTLVSEFNTMISRYNKDVIVMESGYNWTELRGDGYEGQLQDSGYYQSTYGESKDGQKAFLTELYAKLKNVSGGRCLGVLYWDPIMLYDGGKYEIGWAMQSDDYGDWTKENVVSNSNLFDFSSNALESQEAMKYNTESSDKILITGKIDGSTKTEVTFNVNNEDYTVTTDAYGQYIVAVDYAWNGKIGITANGYNGSYYVDAPSDSVLLGDIDFPTTRSDEIPEPIVAPEGYTFPYRIVSANTADGKITFGLEKYANTKAVKMIFAKYKNGELVSIETKDISANEAETFEKSFDYSDGDYKAFVWDLDNLKPFSNTKEN
jgi:arabinogalactan endo-1,4-beta-galactosidase